VNSFDFGELRVEVTKTDAVLTARWLGRSTTADPTLTLKPFLDEVPVQIHKDLAVELDLTQLEYMNSSTFKPILAFVQNASKSASKVTVRYDANKHWQQMSFKTLKLVAAAWDNVSVEC